MSLMTVCAACLVGVVAMASGSPSASAQDRPTPFPLWAQEAPGAKGTAPADIPTLSVYLPPEGKANGAAVVICPGGGYGHLADHEGHPIAQWLNSLGVTAFVLKYRLAPYKHPAMLLDGQRALRLVRARAAEWKIDPDRIGILGFSAGGHLASTLATHFDEGKSDAADPLDRVSCRPNIAVLLYPVITLDAKFTHGGSKKNLLGDNPPSELIELLSNEKQVTAKTPPTFLMHTADDPVVPMENSLLFAMACRKAGVPVELHLYEHGRHGVGLATDDPILHTWTTQCAAWMRFRKFIP